MATLDDRTGKVSPGVKFKDAELIGVPTIVTVGRSLADGNVEVREEFEKRYRTRFVDPAFRPLQRELDAINAEMSHWDPDSTLGAWATLVTAGLAALIVIGSRNLQHFDAALVGYTFATLFAAFGISYRYAMWLNRPPTRMYWRRGWQAFFSRRALGGNTVPGLVARGDGTAQQFQCLLLERRVVVAPPPPAQHEDRRRIVLSGGWRAGPGRR